MLAARHLHGAVGRHAQLEHVGAGGKPPGARLQIGREDEARQRGRRERGLGAEPRLGHGSGPEAHAGLAGKADHAAHFGEPAHPVNLHVPDARPVEREQLARRGRPVQRLVDADRGPQLGREPHVPQQLLGRERLLDVEQPRVVERAQRRLVLRPGVAAVGVHGERYAGAGQRPARRLHRDGIPARRDLDLDPPIAVGERIVDPAPQRVGRAVRRNPQCDATGDPLGRRDAEPLGKQVGQADPAAMRLEVPRRGLERGPRERIAADSVLQQGVHRLRALDLAADQPRDEHLFEQQPRRAEGLLGVERAARTAATRRSPDGPRRRGGPPRGSGGRSSCRPR